MSKSMSENEQQVWLETVSTGKRDNGFRFVLRKVLNNEEFDKVIPFWFKRIASRTIYHKKTCYNNFVFRCLLVKVFSVFISKNFNDSHIQFGEK